MSTLILIGFIGGIITGISPCILPVLPVIFFAGGADSARTPTTPQNTTNTPFPGVHFTGVNLVGDNAQPICALKNHQPAPATTSPWRPYQVVTGLTLSFTFFTLLGSTLLTALGLPQHLIHWAGITLLTLIGIGMLIPSAMEIMERPFARLGKTTNTGPRNGFFLGLVLGAAYIPCAGPVLAAITVAGSTGEIGRDTIALAISFATGTALPLLIFALAGRHVSERISAFRRKETLIRTLAGLSLIALAVGLIFHIPAHIQRLLPDWTNTAQQLTYTWLNGENTNAVSCIDGAEALGECQPLPEFNGITTWLNTPTPITHANTKDHVTLIDFWAYSCINCQKSLPVIQQLHETYTPYGLNVISIHAPEYAFEKEQTNVENAITEHAITFPVGIDNDLTTWRAFNNAYWPSLYLADGRGTIRYFKYGEGPKGLLEQHIRTLLRETNPTIQLPDPIYSTADDEAAPRTTHTILGSNGARGYINGTLPTGTTTHTIPNEQPLDTFALAGQWDIKERNMTAGEGATMKIRYYGTQVTIIANGTGTINANINGTQKPYPLNNGITVLSLATHTEKAKEGTIELTIPTGVELQELEILGNVCGNGKCGGQSPSWAYSQ